MKAGKVYLCLTFTDGICKKINIFEKGLVRNKSLCIFALGFEATDSFKAETNFKITI
ncbi:hypothetical protein [Flavobacterium suncheonense]|uniref:hypothetical protein n=1 Tax=Flavobacterium suncheonense TaxID=350894 RepID=UPI00042286A4|nr:hypothetical protein [Flavobacterium suncheonense]